METGLQRFIKAQEGSYEDALSEIRNGRKTSHWIWYIFPQIKGLGFSYYSEYYGISSRKEAEDFLADRLLGKRLIEMCECLLRHKSKDIEQIMGDIDAMKLKSSMTLFDAIQPGGVFGEVLDVFFGGERCERTVRFLDRG